MSDIKKLVDTYIDMWNETDAKARLAIGERVWEADGSYVDPQAAVQGPEAISAMIGAVQQQFPGLRFRLGRDVDAHHHLARFTWEMGTDAEPDMIVGFDVAEVSEDGKLRNIFGFLDKVPAAA